MKNFSILLWTSRALSRILPGADLCGALAHVLWPVHGSGRKKKRRPCADMPKNENANVEVRGSRSA